MHALYLAQMFRRTRMNGKEPHVKFPSTHPPPSLPPQESGYSHNHLDSVGASVFEVSPRSFCILGIVGSLDHEAALHPCGDEGRPRTRLSWPERSQHVKGRDYGFSIPQGAQNSTGQGPEQPDPALGLALLRADDRAKDLQRSLPTQTQL